MQIWHALQSGVTLLAQEDETSIGRRSVAGEAPEPHAFRTVYTRATCHEGRGDGKASMAPHRSLCFSR